MTTEETIQEKLTGKFPALGGKVRIRRARRIFAEIDMKHFEDVFAFAIKELAFTMLCTITGLDDGTTFGFIYHLAREDGVTLNLKTSVSKDAPIIETMTGYFPTADIYEREIADLFGVTVDGLKPGPRYPLPDDWPKGEYPLRKDWKGRAKPTTEGATDADA
jgi:Ni,Fe-hydrogenase III component G